MVFNFKDLSKAQISRMPFRDSPHHEIEILVSFSYLNLFRPNEHKVDYHIRKPNDKSVLFEIEAKIFIYVGENSICFETHDKVTNYSSDLDFDDIKFPFAYGEGTIHFMFHQKYIPIQEYENSTKR